MSHPQRFERKGASYLMVRADNGNPVLSDAYDRNPRRWERWFDMLLETGMPSIYKAQMYKQDPLVRRILSAFGAA